MAAAADKLRLEFGETMVSMRTMEIWSSRNEWVRLAAEHDARVAQRATQKIETKRANQAFDAIKALTEAAEIALEAATLRNAAVEAAAKGDVRGMIAAGVEALKLKEVLNGGVSDRTGTVSEREREVEDQLAVLERALRSSRAKSPNVVGSGTA